MATIFDLPAHPLMVHFPVVAIPLLAVLGLAMAARPQFRDQYARPIIALAVLTVIATFVAAKSGEELVESLGLKDDFIDPHRDLGSTLRFFVLGLTVAIVGMVAVNKRASATGRDPAAVVSGVLVVAFALQTAASECHPSEPSWKPSRSKRRSATSTPPSRGINERQHLRSIPLALGRCAR